MKLNKSNIDQYIDGNTLDCYNIGITSIEDIPDYITHIYCYNNNLTELPNCDYIVHFAAESHVDNSIKDGRPFVRTNVEGTFNMVELALKVKGLKKFIHMMKLVIVLKVLQANLYRFIEIL